MVRPVKEIEVNNTLIKPESDLCSDNKAENKIGSNTENTIGNNTKIPIVHTVNDPSTTTGLTVNITSACLNYNNNHNWVFTTLSCASPSSTFSSTLSNTLPPYYSSSSTAPPFYSHRLPFAFSTSCTPPASTNMYPFTASSAYFHHLHQQSSLSNASIYCTTGVPFFGPSQVTPTQMTPNVFQQSFIVNNPSSNLPYIPICTTTAAASLSTLYGSTTQVIGIFL